MAKKRRSEAKRRHNRYLSLFLPGVGLALLALTVVAVMAALDARGSRHYQSLLSLLTLDTTGASYAMSLIGTSEGVAIAIVIVVVVLGVQLTADRYSPRIIDVFVRDPMNTLVLALFLGSMVFTIWVTAEIKGDYVPLIGVYTAMGLAVIDFAILLPYVRYMFQIMRAETIIRGIRARAGRALKIAARGGDDVSPRHEIRDALAQVTDIALGSIHEGDTMVCLAAIQSLRELIVDDYMPLKNLLPDWWFVVGHEDMPGASDQIIAHVDRTRTWVEHMVLTHFLDLIGETPAFRKEVIHAIARATRDLGEAAMTHGDPDVVDLVIRFFNTYCRAAIHQRAPTFAYSTFNEYRILAEKSLRVRPEVAMQIAEHMVTYGRAFDAAGMPLIIGTAAEDVADVIIIAATIDADRALLLTQLLVRTLEGMAPVAQPLALNGVMKAMVKLALWAIAENRDDIAGTLVYGLRAVPREFLEQALSRMERTQDEVFSEVNDRVVAFDWVSDTLRELIPVLRGRLDAASEVNQAARKPRRPHPVSA